MARKSRHRRGLPAEIEREILLRLPVKTLRRFQSTRKSWYSLISSPEFQRDHQFLHSRNTPLLLTVREDDEDPLTLQFSAYTNSKEETLVKTFSKKVPYICNDDILPIQSGQGLLCLASILICNPSILICNPSTEELIVLPHSQRQSHCFGFGYAASTQEFKVVNFVNDPFDDPINIISFCEGFTLGSADWREAKSPPYYSSGVAPFLHGALHLPPDLLEEDIDYIAAFDLETEEYKCIPLPTYYRTTLEDKELENIQLAVLRGSLCLTFVFCPHLEFLILKDYNNTEWEKAYTVDMSRAINVARVVPRGYCLRIDAIGIMRDESVLLFSDSGTSGAHLWCYDPQSGIFTQKFDDISAAAFYEESFFSLGTR